MATGRDIKQPYDWDIFGGFDSKGEIKNKKGREAWINAFKLWLLNKEGDFIRRPKIGGYLYNWLTKPMSDKTQKDILLSLRTGIRDEFRPKLEIQTLDVIPDYERKIWSITVGGYIPEIDETIEFSQDFRSLI